jgi:hypothetical protein
VSIGIPARWDLQPHRHDNAEPAGGVAANARAEFVAEAEGAADFQSVGQEARVERDHWWIAVGFDWHLHGGAVAVGVAMGQGELTTLVPIEPHRALVLSE